MAKKNQLTKSDYLPMEEYKKLLRLLHKDRQYLWELYARLAFCTALRVSDVLSLAWADILHKGSLTKIEKKTGKVRKIPFNLSIQTRIEELYILLKRPNPNELLLNRIFNHSNIEITKIYICIREDEINSIFDSIRL